MMRSRLARRLAALGILAGLVLCVGIVAWSWADAYADGQHEIADKRNQLRNLRELAEARAGLDRLARKSAKVPLVLQADANPQDALAAAIAHAGENPQVIVDGVEALPAEPTLVSAAVRLRGTQQGLSDVLRVLEDQTPYLVIPRFEITPFRAADIEHGKPLVLSADIRVAALVAPAVQPRAKPATAPSETAP